MRLVAAALLVVAVARAASAQVEPPPSPPREAPPPPSSPEPSTTTSTSTSTTTSTTTTTTQAPDRDLDRARPPHPTSPPAGAGGEEIRATPDPTSTTTSDPTATPDSSEPTWRPKGADFCLTGYAGAYGGGASVSSGGGGDILLLVLGERMAFGARFSIEGIGDDAGPGVGLALGPRFPLASWARLDVLADVGIAFFGDKEKTDCTAILSCEKRSDSFTTVPMFGLRSGITFLPGDGRTSLTLGGFVRVLPEKQVEITRETCGTIFPGCTATSRETKTFGGRLFGAFLTVGFPRRF